MYSISGHHALIVDRVRTGAYVRALREAIQPGSVVLDIGTGTGIFALLACRLGARKVYALEPADVLQVARENAAANGYAGSIEFIQDLSTNVTLPQRADVIVSDLHGILPWFQQHLPAIVDARRRLLAPGGRLIPQCDRVWAAPVEAPELYPASLTPAEPSSYGLDLTALSRRTTNSWNKSHLQPRQLLAQPQCLSVLDYRKIESFDLSAQSTHHLSRSGDLHGFAVWFDSTLSGDIGFSNAPGEPELIYGQAFFPCSAPVPVEGSDRVSFECKATLTADDYIWRWNTQVADAAGQVRARFEQSTFQAAPLALHRLRKRASGHIPVKNAAGELDSFMLALMDGKNSLESIARCTCTHFPDRFARWEEALTRAAELSQKYSR